MLGTENDPGIIPRAIQQIFQFCTPDDSIGISFYEIHNEKAFDLLSPSELKVPLKIGETAGEFYLPQLKQHWPDSESDAKCKSFWLLQWILCNLTKKKLDFGNGN